MQNKNAFTLVEILLIMALIALIAAFSVPLFNTFQTGSDIKVAADIVAQSLKRAESLAESGENDSNWGVHIATGTITVFNGNTYATRDTTFDDLFTISTDITATGLTDIVYTKFTGEPQSTGNIVLTADSGEVWTINLNSKGTVSY